jgi:hypothetical protein
MTTSDPPVGGEHLTESFYATQPTRFTVFMRTFIPWQLWKFARLNLKMILIIGKSHH